ncbi:BPL-N domain-containing protein [Planctomicrobium sp. SH664]|uniref:BPL-N domain-containing protein n=1 Tax=Planctomicrobium sp. SH664 TaxID=3448125 RepID=UPI003F5C738B
MRLFPNPSRNTLRFSLIALCWMGVVPLSATAADPIRVAIYDHSEGKARYLKVLARILGDNDVFHVDNLSPAQIRKGALNQGYHVLIMPEGSGSYQSSQLKETGRENIKEFVRNGGGYVGICAGSYLASSHFDWSLGLLNAEMVDAEHWARGNGQVKLHLTPAGQAALKSSKADLEVYYAQGPLLAPGSAADLPPYESLAEFTSEMAEKGAPSGVMVGTTAIARGEFGKGRVFCFSPHCESRGGPNYMVVNAVLWAAGQEDRETPTRLESFVPTPEPVSQPQP